MKRPPDVTAAAPGPGGRKGLQDSIDGESTREVYPARRWQVEIVRPDDGRVKVFNSYDSREAAEIAAAKLRAHKIFAQVRRDVRDE